MTNSKKLLSLILALVLVFSLAISAMADTEDEVGNPNEDGDEITAGADDENTDDADVETGPFSDLEGYSWAEEAILALYEAEIVNGVGDNSFQPAASIKRGDFILMLYRAYGLTAETDGNFADVEEDMYYAEALAVAKALNIAQGDGENFYPESNITRQEAMTLIYRTLVVAEFDLESYAGDLESFTDNESIADWALEAISALVGAEVIFGSDNMINPLGNMSRAEMAVALYRALNNIQ